MLYNAKYPKNFHHTKITRYTVYSSCSYLCVRYLIVVVATWIYLFLSFLWLSITQYFLPADKTIKLWKISERCRRYSNLNTLTDDGQIRKDRKVTELKVPVKNMDDVSIEAMPRRIFSNGHTYHINSISVNSDDCTYLSADDLRVNLWDLERTDQSFSILPLCVVWVWFVCLIWCVL